MINIITDTTLAETKLIAKEKWHEYKAAARAFNDPIYSDLQKVYNQIKSGKKVIDIHKVIQKGGVHSNNHPKLAIAQATIKKVQCKYFQNGNVHYFNPYDWRSEQNKSGVVLNNCLPMFQLAESWRNLSLEAPVPIIPPKLLPKKLTDDYYILWEVDEWKMVPPTDPYLLRRITKTMFVVVSGWDLTEIEKAAMAGRMY